MQNLSNATTTRFQLNSIPEKNSKNVKKVFSAFLPPHAVAVPCAIREERRDMRGNGENYIITFWLPSLATLVFFVYIFIFSVLLFTSVCLLRVRKRFSSLNIQAISTSHPMHIFPLMKWYHEHSFEIKHDFFFGGEYTNKNSHRWKWNISNIMKFYPLTNNYKHTRSIRAVLIGWKIFSF